MGVRSGWWVVRLWRGKNAPDRPRSAEGGGGKSVGCYYMSQDIGVDPVPPYIGGVGGRSAAETSFSGG
jgi:hypothetical protein